MTEAQASPNGSTGAMDIQQIMRMIMHRYPFLLVDRVIDCVPGDHIAGYKNTARGEPMFEGRAPGAAVMPQLLVIEALAQISVILTYKTLRIEPTGQELMFFAGIDDARFGVVVRPGDRLDLRSDVIRIRKSLGWFKGRAEVGGRMVAEMSMLAAIRIS